MLFTQVIIQFTSLLVWGKWISKFDYIRRWEADLECEGSYPIAFITIERTLSNIRNERFRKTPTHCSQIEITFEDELMRSLFCHSFHKERYEIYDTTYNSEEFGYCVFSSKKSINLIIKEQPREEERFLVMDATFSITPSRMFYQVLIIYARYFEKVTAKFFSLLRFSTLFYPKLFFRRIRWLT